jgi:short-subunit dehydrogenase
MNLQNKTVVITGGTKGLGKALACLFLEEKAKVIINARSKKELDQVSKEIGAVPFVGDVDNENDMKKLAAFVVKKFGQIDIWINNVGIGMGHMPIEKVDAKQAHKVMEVNFFGTFYGSRSAMKYMKEKKQGTIINVLSSRAIVPGPNSIIYSSSKWAARGFTEALRVALKSDKVLVVAAYPSGMKTDFFGKVKPEGYKNYMEPSYVAGKIVQNLKLSKPKEEVIIKDK